MNWLYAAISWIVFGVIAGAIARFLVPGRQEMGCLPTMILGVLGSIIGGVIGSLLSGGEPFQPSGWIGSIICAVLLLLAYRKFGSKPAA